MDMWHVHVLVPAYCCAGAAPLVTVSMHIHAHTCIIHTGAAPLAALALATAAFLAFSGNACATHAYNTDVYMQMHAHRRTRVRAV